MVLGLLADGKPRGVHDISVELGLGKRAVEGACYRGWVGGVLFRSSKPVYGGLRQFRGRAGSVSTFRGFYLYLVRVEGQESARQGEIEFVPYGEEYLSSKVPKGESKAKRILRFLEENKEKAWYTTNVVKALKEWGIQPSVVMPAIHRFEAQGLLFVRGYRTETKMTPFGKGFLVTYLDQSVPRDKAIREALQRTEEQLTEDSGSNVVGQRIRAIRDQIIIASEGRDLVGYDFLKNHINCTDSELKTDIDGMKRLYRDIRQIDIFKQPYFYTASFPADDLRAAVMMKESYIRQTKGRDNRIGHNFESAIDWFIDKIQSGAQFWTQNHRDSKMDNRRITLHLIKPVGRRKGNAEVDRVWSITPSPIAQEITYVLQSKWSIVTKGDLDDHLEVLKWSQEFGVDTSNGREIKAGIQPIFAGGAFDPTGRVKTGDYILTLGQYAQRLNIQLLKASDLNDRLNKHGIDKEITLQRICRLAKDEKEVRETLNKLWNQPEKSSGFINDLAQKNKELYEFEEKLETTRKSDEPITTIE